jgi:hypothetical protein
VVLDNVNTSLTADNVQGAFEETQPKLSEIIVGEWDVKYYESCCSELKTQEGIIIFNNDGTYTYNNYVGQEFSTDFKTYLGEAVPKNYKIIDESFLSTTGSRDSEEWTKIRDFTFISANKLISKGKLERPETIYILTRHTEE